MARRGAISRLGLAFWRAAARFNAHDGTVLSGHIAFSALLSLFPFLIFLAALAALFGESVRVSGVVDLVAGLMPPEVVAAIEPAMRAVLEAPHRGLLTFGGLAALWAASSGFEALRIALDRAAEVPEPRHFIWRRLQGVLFVLVTALLVLAFLGALVVAPLVLRALPQVEVPVFLTFAQVAVLPALLCLALMALYRFLPNLGHPRWTDGWGQVLPGAVLAALPWLGLVNLFSAYLRNIGLYNAIYGGLGGVVATLLFFYIGAAVVIYGAELNAVLARRPAPAARPLSTSGRRSARFGRGSA